MNNNFNGNPQVRKKLNEKAAIKKIPLNGIFELTPLCNMNCKMCFIRMSQKEMEKSGSLRSAKQWIQMGRQCVDAGMLFLLITGGEPFLRPDFKEIYTNLNKMGVMITINSNGTLIDEKTVAWLKKAPPTRINITMYGSSNETYARLCQNLTGYDKVTKAIDMLLDAGIKVRINVSFTPENINDMAGIFEFASKRKIPVRPTIYMFPPIRKVMHPSYDDIEQIRFTAEEAGNALFQAEKYRLGEEKMRMLFKLRESNKISELEEECGSNDKNGIGCYGGQCFFWITWDGRMLPCGMMNEPVSKPFDKGFLNSWKEIWMETEKMHMPRECVNCENRKVCTACMAVVKSEGDGKSSPKYLCTMTETYKKLCDEVIGK